MPSNPAHYEPCPPAPPSSTAHLQYAAMDEALYCCIDTPIMCPATLHTMRPVRQPRPIRPISNMPPWARRRRRSIVLRTTTREVHSDGASIDALAVFDLPACSSRTPGPAGTRFTLQQHFLFFIFFLSRLRPMGLNVLGYQPHLPTTLPSCLWSRSIFRPHAFCYGSQNKRPDFVKTLTLDSARYSDLRRYHSQYSTPAKEADRACVVV